MIKKIGLLGLGHLGKIHLKCLLNTPFTVIGAFDPDDSAFEYAERSGIKLHRFHDPLELVKASDCVDIVSPTIYHYELAAIACREGKDVFIEKPVTTTVEESESLLELEKAHGVIVQVGHVERYNPAFHALDDMIDNPKFIEGHRLALFNPRGTDVSVILDLMIHDLDLVLSIVKSDVKNVYANGVSIVSATPDICNARIEFENGCVANLTASRISLKNMRKLRVFKEDAYLSLDFLSKKSQVVNISPVLGQEEPKGMTIDTQTGKKEITIQELPVVETNAIEEELNDFYKSVVERRRPKVNLEDGYKALKLAHLIQLKIDEQHEI